MKNSHLEKSERNKIIREFLVSGRSQSQVARECGITVQRVNMLVDRFIRQGLLVKTDKGFITPEKVDPENTN